MKKPLIVIGVVLILSIILGYVSNMNDNTAGLDKALEIVDTSRAVFPQEVESKTSTPVEIIKLYHADKLVGIIRNENGIENMFQEVYETEYKEDFPNSKLSFIDDIYQTKELSFNIYKDRDDEIFNYIHEQDLFAIESNKVTFSNGAVIYVKDTQDFNNARDRFIKNFISETSFNLFKNQELPPELTENGIRDIGLKVLESIVTEKGLATKDNILKNEEDILMFLNYGYEPKMETYTVQQFDTVDGVGSLNGMSGAQIASINSDKIKDVNQVLEVGMELNVTKFNSPFTVQVTRELKTSEVIYPEDIDFVEDPTLTSGKEVVDVVPQDGEDQVTYEILYVNGEQKQSVEVSRKQVTEPVRGVTRVGTKKEILQSTGGGAYRWPLEDGRVICGYGCYGGHAGVDMQPWGVYGPIYSIDRGVVAGKGFNGGGWGYWVRINHGNGYQSLYAHMSGPAAVSVGEVVSASQYLGQVGSTGRVTTPHLHLEIWDSSGSKLNACNGFVSCRY